MAQVTLNQIRQALQLKDFDASSAHQKMMPLGAPQRIVPENEDNIRIGAVLVLLYYRDQHIHLVLTKRRDDLQAHAGQISFPGGRQEESEPLLDTALRETEEEIGVPTTAVLSLGRLTSIYIPPSGFLVHPFVGWYQNGKELEFFPSSDEVAEIIEVPLASLLDTAAVSEEPWNFRGHQVLVPYFAVKEHKVWGATAIMLSEFVERLRTINRDA